MLMQRVSNGYTIIEVLIFLAISGMLLIIAFTFLSGSEAHTRFSQSMHDMQSKIQDWTNDVTTGFAGNISGTTNGSIHCKLAGQKPQITDNGNPSGNPDCIFLGKAIQFTDSNSPPISGQESKVYAYSIFGRRLDSSGNLVGDLADANPTAATGVGNNGKTDLTEEYDIGGGAKVLSVTSAGVANSHMAGFFLSFNQLNNSTNGSEDLKAYQYSLTNNNAKPADQDSAQGPVDTCISLATPCDTLNALQSWVICFGNDSNNDTAVLTISSSNGTGATTNLEFKACS